MLIDVGLPAICVILPPAPSLLQEDSSDACVSIDALASAAERLRSHGQFGSNFQETITPLRTGLTRGCSEMGVGRGLRQKNSLPAADPWASGEPGTAHYRAKLGRRDVPDTRTLSKRNKMYWT